MGFFAIESKVRGLISELLEPTKHKMQETERDIRQK
jgi:hypothetical protein